MPESALYLIDTVTVASGRVDRYLAVLQGQMVPLYRGAGARFEYCRTTAGDLGEPVEVQLAWSFADNVAWNEIRKALVLDARYYECALSLAGLRQDGTRRFHRDVAASPAS